MPFWCLKHASTHLEDFLSDYLEQEAAPSDVGRDAVAVLADDLDFRVGKRETLFACLLFYSSTVVIVVSALDPDNTLTEQLRQASSDEATGDDKTPRPGEITK